MEQLAKLKADEDAKLRLSDCTKHYESQIRTMRINHEQVCLDYLIPLVHCTFMNLWFAVFLLSSLIRA